MPLSTDKAIRVALSRHATVANPPSTPVPGTGYTKTAYLDQALYSDAQNQAISTQPTAIGKSETRVLRES
jgi:hypothetical protein